MALIPTTQGNPQATDIAVESALPMVGSGVREDLQATLGFVDAEIAKLFEDRNVLLTGGGTISYNGAGTVLTFSEALNLEINSKIAGGAPVVIQLVAASGTKNLSANGRMLYAVVNRTGGTATVTDDSATLPAVTSANQEVFLIAKRRDNTTGPTPFAYFRDGSVIEAGKSNRLDGTVASGISVDAALPMIGSAADDSLLSVLQKVDPELAKLFEDRNLQLADGGLITWTGTSLQFTQSLKLHINSRSTGAGANEPPAVIDLGSATQTMANGDMMYVVLVRPADPTTTGSATPVIVSTATGLPRVTSANQEIFLIAKSITSGDGLSRIYFRNGTALDAGQTARLGGAGSGSGSGNTILETLKNEFVDSPYQLLTPNIISTDTNTKFASFSGAAYDLVNKVIKYTADAQNAVSINMLDLVEFLAQGIDVASVDLTVFWNKGTSLQAFTVPPSFTYEVSRDGGTNYSSMTMSRVGTTETFRGNLTFATEVTQQNLATQTGSTLNRDLTQSGADQQLSQSFVVPSGQTWVLTQVVLNVTKTGTPGGNLFASVVNNSAGVPSTALVDVLGQSNAVLASSLTTGANTVVIPKLVLVPGTYHVVVSSDAAYKATGTFASNKIQLQDASTLTGESTYNGTTWTAQSPARGLIYTLQGRSLDLRVRITSSGAPTYPVGLDGYGIFYNVNDFGLVGATKKLQRFVFNSVTDNLSSFAITSFTPDPDLLEIFWAEGGQVFKVPAFQLNGNTAVFPTNTFNQGGVSQTITLIATQNTGGAFDNSDSNARLMATNHLGSTSGTDDKSASGRGIQLRNANGVLRELALDANDNIIILSTP